MSERKSVHLHEEGDELEPLEFTVSPELNQQYLYAVEDFHPRYIERSDLGPPLVHPSLLLNMSNRTRSPSYYLDPGVAGIAAANETEFINPAVVGKRLTIRWKVSEIFERRGRTWHACDTLMIDEDGREILRRRNRSTFATASSPESKPDSA